MYLISLTNYDYIWVAAFFSAFFLIAYLYRRQNSSYAEFVVSDSKLNILAFSGFGLIEIVGAGIGGSYYGFNAIYALALVIILVYLGQRVLTKRYLEAGVVNFSDYVYIRYGKFSAFYIALLQSVLFTMCITLLMCLIFKSLHALMGWNFGNSVFGLFGISLIAVVIGGRSGVTANKLLNYLIILLAFICVIAIAFYKLGGVEHFFANLENLAKAKQISANYYSQMPISLSDMLVFIGLVIALGGFYLLNFTLTANYSLHKPRAISLIIRLLIVVMLVMPGIIAIATPIGSAIAGKQIITIEAQLPDGQMGYIVKAIDNADKDTSRELSPGLIPPLLNPNTNLVEKGKYDYLLSNIVTFRHYFPKQMFFLILLMLLAGFMATLADYLINIGQVVVKNILVPYNLIARYGVVGQLWALRLAILGFGAITLAIANYIAPSFSFLSYVLLMSALVIAPLTALIFLIILNAKVNLLPISLSLGIISGSVCVSIMSDANIIHKYVLCGLICFLVVFLSGLIMGQLKK